MGCCASEELERVATTASDNEEVDNEEVDKKEEEKDVQKEASSAVTASDDAKHSDELLTAETLLYPVKGVSQLCMTVIQARNLPNMDILGHSDPYVVVKVADKSFESNYIQDTGEPVFNYSIKTSGPDLLDTLRTEGVSFEIWDRDVANDDKIGVAVLKDMGRFVDKAPSQLWLDIRDEVGGKKSCGKLELSVQIISEVKKVSERSWTHLIEMDVLGIKRLDKLQVPWAFEEVSKAKLNPRVRLEWSTQVLCTGSSKTSADVVTGDDHCLEWKERCYLFMDTERHESYKLKLKLEAGDGRYLEYTDVLPEGFMKAKHFFDAIADAEAADGPSIVDKVKGKMKDALSVAIEEVTEDADDFKDKSQALPTTDAKLSTKFHTVDIPLSSALVAADSELGELVDTTTPDIDESKIVGYLSVRFSVNPRPVVEENFYSALIDKVDESGDGRLQKIELEKLMFLMEMDTPVFEIQEWLDKFSFDSDGALDKDEIMGMLRDHKFTSSRMFSHLFFQIVKDSGEVDGDDIMTASLMSSVTRNTFVTDGRRVIELKDRGSGLIVCENIADYVWYALKLMYSGGTGVLSHSLDTVLYTLSRKQGTSYDAPESVDGIDAFIALHNLRKVEIVKPLDDFRTFNDFFARAIDVDRFRPMPSGSDLVVSAADCRLMAFKSFVESTEFWVKGARFTLGNLLGHRSEAVAPKLTGGPFVIFRLAPQDYHRWHWPVSGTVKAITPIAGALFTVNPLAINSQLDVYTENKRCVIEIDTGDDHFGLVVLVAVAATCVGSYNLFQKDESAGDAGVVLEVGHVVKQGDVSGEFRFGGSTILLLMEPGRIELDGDLLSNSAKKLETLMRARMHVAKKI